MDKFYGWIRVFLTWVVIIPNLAVSYVYLRSPSYNLEISSLALNFVATTVLFYIYMDIFKDSNASEEEEDKKTVSKDDEEPLPLYKLTFGSLIEDMSVWLVLFFALYNIVPVTLFVHNLIAKMI